MPDRRSKLSQKDITSIRKMALNMTPLQDIASQYHVHPSTISRLIAGKTWKGETQSTRKSILHLVEDRNEPEQQAVQTTAPALAQLERTILSHREKIQELGDAAAIGIEQDLVHSILPDAERSDEAGDGNLVRTSQPRGLQLNKRVPLDEILKFDPHNTTASLAKATGEDGWVRAVEIAAGLLPNHLWSGEQFTTAARAVHREISKGEDGAASSKDDAGPPAQNELAGGGKRERTQKTRDKKDE